MPEHKKIWNDWCDRYYLELINMSVNEIPKPPKDFNQMEEAELNSWLSKIDFNEVPHQEKQLKIDVPLKQDLCQKSQTSKTEVFNLPLSLEDNSTLNGTASIFNEFAKEFSFPCLTKSEIPFNKSEKKFDLHAGRKQFDFMRSVELHHAQMNEFEKQLKSIEKGLDGVTVEDLPPSSDSDSDDSGDKDTQESVSTNNSKTPLRKRMRFLQNSVRKSMHRFKVMPNLTILLTNL
jgi:hypothetical protein